MAMAVKCRSACTVSALFNHTNSQVLWFPWRQISLSQCIFNHQDDIYMGINISIKVIRPPRNATFLSRSISMISASRISLNSNNLQKKQCRNFHGIFNAKCAFLYTPWNNNFTLTFPDMRPCLHFVVLFTNSAKNSSRTDFLRKTAGGRRNRACWWLLRERYYEFR